MVALGVELVALCVVFAGIGWSARGAYESRRRGGVLDDPTGARRR